MHAAKPHLHGIGGDPRSHGIGGNTCSNGIGGNTRSHGIGGNTRSHGIGGNPDVALIVYMQADPVSTRHESQPEWERWTQGLPS
eukprot:270746-Chlamydomonas_euryale.AAC.9